MCEWAGQKGPLSIRSYAAEEERRVDTYLEMVHCLETDAEIRGRFAADPEATLRSKGVELPREYTVALIELVRSSNGYNRGSRQSGGNGGWGRFSYGEFTPATPGTR
jgi:hypothetical protein